MKTFTAIVLISLIVSLSILEYPVKAQEPLNLTIKPDGSVEPATDLLARNGSTYTFKGDIFGTIWVQTSNIVIDGAGYTLEGNGVDNGQNSDIGILLGGPDLSHRVCHRVLVENLRIYNIPRGIFTVGSSNNSFIGNFFDKSGIQLQGGDYIGNQIRHNTFNQANIFIDYNGGGLDVIAENNLVDSVIFVDLSVPPIVDRNYWSNYTAEYPSAKEVDNSGIWNTPNVYDKFVDGSHGNYSCIDYHPLVNPITDFTIPAFSNTISTPTPSLSTASPTPTSISPAILGAALLVLAVAILVMGLIFKRKSLSKKK
jgi:hypothetical protein